MSNLELPGEYTFGFVTGRIIQAVADSPADDDRFPEARAATGQVTFKPSVELRKSSSHYHAFVGFTVVAANLDKLGRLVDDQTWKAIQDGAITGDDPDGPHGIWLVTGSYLVTPSVVGARIAPFTVEVTADHTEANPLDLVTAAPPQPAPGVTLQTLTVPPGGGPNETLVRGEGGGLSWSSAAYDSAQDAQAAISAIPSEVAAQVLSAVSSEVATQLPPVVTAELATQGIEIDTTVGTKVTIGGVVIHYDSGLRDVSSLLGPGWYPPGGVNYVVLSRVGRRVTFAARLGVTETEIPEASILDVPTGFRPGHYQYFGDVYTSTGSDRLMRYPYDSLVTLSDTPRAGDTVMFTVSWETPDPYPTTLPGTPYVAQEEEW